VPCIHAMDLGRAPCWDLARRGPWVFLPAVSPSTARCCLYGVWVRFNLGTVFGMLGCGLDQSFKNMVSTSLICLADKSACRSVKRRLPGWREIFRQCGAPPPPLPPTHRQCGLKSVLSSWPPLPPPTACPGPDYSGFVRIQPECLCQYGDEEKGSMIDESGTVFCVGVE